MKLRELQSLMQDIQPFADPKVELEQYPTGPHLAARLLFTVDSMYDEFGGRTVVDLGCGTAMLAIGSAMLGASHVLGIDCDADALATAADNIAEFEGLEVTRNIAEFEGLQVDLLQCDVAALPSLAARRRGALAADTVVMNPPFGTRTKGADVAFLRAAFAISSGAVYSLHKSSTRTHIQKVALGELKAASATVLAELRYDLPATYAFHRQKSKDIQVDLWRFEVGKRPVATS